MDEKSFVLYQDLFLDGCRYLDRKGNEFSAWKFSFMKLGDMLCSTEMGIQLARAAIIANPKVLQYKRVGFAGPPEFYAPSTAYVLMNACRKEIDRQRMAIGLLPTQLFRLNKIVPALINFGDLTAVQRIAHGNDRAFRVYPAMFGPLDLLIKGDDFKSTGTTQKIESALLCSTGLPRVYHIVYASLGAELQKDPTIEGRINRSAGDPFEVIGDLISDNSYYMQVKLLKEFFKAELTVDMRERLKGFLLGLPKGLLFQMHTMAMG